MVKVSLLLGNYLFRADYKRWFFPPIYFAWWKAIFMFSPDDLFVNSFCLKPCCLCSLSYMVSIATRMRRWYQQPLERMEMQWKVPPEITICKSLEHMINNQESDAFWETAYLGFGMCSFFWQLLFLVLFLALIFFFETKIKIIKKQKFNLTLHVIQWQM